MTFISKIKQFSRQQNLFQKGNKIIVGVSGGPDSVSLLYALYELRPFLKISLHVAHLNHKLRKSSELDQKFVQNLSKKFSLPYTCKTVKIKKQKQSLEEVARNERIKFFVNLAKKEKAAAIALGHTQDDLAETVLMRILRGTGIFGIRSILPKRKIYNTMFVRPLLKINRKEIEQFLKRKNIKFRIDPSNKKNNFFRNKIRLELIPLLEKKYAPGIKEALSRLSENACISHDYLHEKSQKIFKKISKSSTSKKHIKIRLDYFKKIHLAMQRIIIRLAVEYLQGNTRQMTLSHVEEIEDLIKNRPLKSIVNLPSNIIVSKQKSTLTFEYFAKS